MRSIEIERWALGVIDSLRAKQPIEDSRVEAKREWPLDIPKAARRIAGHANAARGESILWLIGLDETAGVVGVEQHNVAQWYDQVAAQFDGPVPAPQDINIAVDSKTIVAIAFSTERAPYVVRNPTAGQKGCGPVELEVPWRIGTRVKSAGHAELIRLLTPFRQIPQVEVLFGSLTRTLNPRENRKATELWSWMLQLELYMLNPMDSPVFIPFHHCDGYFRIPGYCERTPFREPMVFSPIGNSGAVRPTDTELLINGPGVFSLVAHADTSEALSESFQADAQIYVALRPHGAERSVTVEIALPFYGRDSGQDMLTWQHRLTGPHNRDLIAW